MPEWRSKRRLGMPQPLIMYTTPWCGYCRRLKSQLAREGIEITEVDIERESAAAEHVMKINGGYQTVPTVLFPDGSTLTNPSVRAVTQRLADLAVAR
jgi:mycoredoxin